MLNIEHIHRSTATASGVLKPPSTVFLAWGACLEAGECGVRVSRLVSVRWGTAVYLPLCVLYSGLWTVFLVTAYHLCVVR